MLGCQMFRETLLRKQFSLIICGRYVPLILDRDLDTKFAKPTKKDKGIAKFNGVDDTKIAL